MGDLGAKEGTLDLSCGAFKRESEVEMEDDDGGLFNIEVSFDECMNDSDKVPRDFQSEEDFQRQKKEWKPKVERGEASILFRELATVVVEMYLRLIRSGRHSSCP